jgi:N-acetylneuraminic acid mutarotase
MHPLILTSAVLGACLAAALPAQADFDLDKRSPGTLGSLLRLEAYNAPTNRLLLVMMAYTAGPTPIAQFDPADPRSVDLGLELAANWYVLGTSPAGRCVIDTAIPNSTAFQGTVLRWQTATFPGTTRLVDQLSNAVVTQLGGPGTSSPLATPLGIAHLGATVCALPQANAGQGDFLLVTGGSSERFRFRSLDGAPGPSMQNPRGLSAAARLANGRVLFTGGVDATGATIPDCEIYDPATDSFVAAAPLPGPRAGHAAVTLADGRVMVAGGASDFTDLTIAATTALNSVAIYQPTTNTWSNGPALGGRRLAPALTLLGNGRVLASGGIEVTVLFGIPINVTSTNRAQLYNPATNSWSNAANMPNGRAYHQENQVLLADGRVLLTGGVLVPDLLNAANAAAIDKADVYNPTTNTWTATTMAVARVAHTATRLADGRVLVTGGTSGLLSASVVVDAVERFDPATNAWTNLAPLQQARAGHTAVQLPDGLLVLLGGGGTTGEARHL